MKYVDRISQKFHEFSLLFFLLPPNLPTFLPLVAKQPILPFLDYCYKPSRGEEGGDKVDGSHHFLRLWSSKRQGKNKRKGTGGKRESGIEETTEPIAPNFGPLSINGMASESEGHSNARRW